MPAHLPFAGSAAFLVGQFRYFFDSELWEWSAEAAQIHGYPAVEMTPSSQQVMSHQHPGEYAKIAVAMEHVRRSHGSINSRHRIIDVQGSTREVVIVGQQLCDDDGYVMGTHGFYVDVTSSGTLQTHDAREREQLVARRVADIAERRTVIDEVKGMLMLVYHIDDATAFELLRWRAQLTSTKLRELAEQLRDDFAALAYDETLPPRSHFDQLLLTAHVRVPHRVESSRADRGC